MDASTDIKNIVPKEITTIVAVDDAITVVRTAIASMAGQMEMATQGDLIKLGDFDEKDRIWFLRVKGAHRHAKVTLNTLIARRDELLRDSGSTVTEVIEAIESSELDEDGVTLLIDVAATKGQQWLKSLKALLSNLKGK